MNSTTLILSKHGNLGIRTAEKLTEIGQSGTLLAPSFSPENMGLPTGWAHLRGSRFEVETLSAISESIHNALVVLSMHLSPDEDDLRLVSCLGDAVATQGGTLVIAREDLFDSSGFDPTSVARKSALIRRSEEMIRDLSLTRGFQAAFVNLPHIYGPGVTRGPLQEQFRASTAGEPCSWPGKPNEAPRLIHVRDACNALSLAFQSAARGGVSFHVEGEPEITMAGLAGMVGDFTGNRSRVTWPDVTFFETLLGTYSEDNPGRPSKEKSSGGTRLKSEFGKRIPLGEGLRETLISFSNPG